MKLADMGLRSAQHMSFMKNSPKYAKFYFLLIPGQNISCQEEECLH